VYQFIRAHGKWDNWEMVVIKLYPCGSKQELEIEEERIKEELEEFSTLNRNRAWAGVERKLPSKEYSKKYNEIHKEEKSEQRKEYYEEHKEEIIERREKYRKEHKEEYTEYHKKYRETHKEEIKEKQKEQYTCGCGSTLTKAKKTRHEKNKEHQHWLKTGEKLKIKGEQYTCGCGSTLTKYKKNRHETSQKHKKWLESQK
jgi:hypothetical protein